MPSRCGVGPMTAGPCGEKNSDAGSTFSGASSWSLFLFVGVDVRAFGSWVGLRLVVALEGVWGAGLLESRSRSLL